MKTEEPTPNGKVHPIAAMFPRLPEQELNDLAASIKEIGLKEPIVLWNGMIVDGINRDAACKIAGVKPSYQELNGTDPVKYIFGKNATRRHMTKGQLAMVVVKAEMETTSLQIQNFKRGTTRRLATTAGVDEFSISHALKIARYAPAWIDDVITGAKSMDSAFKDAEDNEQAANSSDAQLKRLQKEAPDFATRVIEEQLSLEEAIHLARKREEDLKAHRLAVTKLISQCVGILNPRAFSVQEYVDYLCEGYDEKTASEDVTPEVLDSCAAVLTGFVRKFKKRKDAQ
jgi:hypothetical protein